MNSSKYQWQVLELRVKDALEALGYVVIRDKLMAGTQIDLYAEQNRELFVHRLVIECKATARPIGVEEVRQLYATVSALTTPQRPIFGLMVSSGDFAKTARQFAEQTGMIIKTHEELAALCFDPIPIVSHTITWFETDELARAYVNLSCQASEDKGTIYKPVESFFDQFFSSTRRTGVAVLGNFGTGKTSLCKHYAYLLAQRWESQQPNSHLPIYVNLRDLHDLHHLEDDITSILNTNYYVAVTKTGLLQWLEYGSTLLILDGFDEMASRLDRTKISSSLEALSRFTKRYSVKLILTCRTHFFKTQVDEGKLGDLVRLYIRDWGIDELIDYVQKFSPYTAEAAVEAIRSTYNLEGLSRTPLFLNMIVSTLEQLGSNVNKSKLYQRYTDRWIESQDYRSRLTSEDKRRFMEELAYHMFQTNTPRIPHTALAQQVAESFRLRDYESVEAFDKDIRTCSFLIRDPNGLFYFVHRSYMEFFVAIKLASQVKAKDLDDFMRVELTHEVASFFSEFFESDWALLIRLLVGGTSELCRSNCAMSLGLLRYNKQIHDSLLLALDTENSLLVRRRIVDSLATFGRPEGISEILKSSDAEGDFGRYCLSTLAPFSKDPAILAKYRAILEHDTDAERVVIVLRAARRDTSEMFRSSILSLIDNDWWYQNTDVVNAILEAVPVVADVAFAMKMEEFFTRFPFDTHQKSRAGQVTEELVLMLWPEIEADADSNRRKGLAYRENEGNMRAKYGYLVATEIGDKASLTRLLDKLYGGATRKRSRDRKR